MSTLKNLLFIVMALFAVSVGGAQRNESLLIGPGDQLQIRVFDTPELDQIAHVTDAGTIPLMLGSNVTVASQTPERAARSIERALIEGKFLLHPHVSVTVLEYATQKVSVIGEVKAPGAFAINTPKSVLHILTLAGGLTELADRRILIERKGTKERIPYFVTNQPDVAFESAVMVNPGDSVVVPKAGIVYVLGDVARPGGYTITNNEAQISVLQLIARAGGTNHSAAPAHARLLRKTSSAYSESSLSISAMQKGKALDVQLQANDILYVPFSYLRNIGMQMTGVVGSLASATIYQF